MGSGSKGHLAAESGNSMAINRRSVFSAAVPTYSSNPLAAATRQQQQLQQQQQQQQHHPGQLQQQQGRRSPTTSQTRLNLLQSHFNHPNAAAAAAGGGAQLGSSHGLDAGTGEHGRSQTRSMDALAPTPGFAQVDFIAQGVAAVAAAAANPLHVQQRRFPSQQALASYDTSTNHAFDPAIPPLERLPSTSNSATPSTARRTIFHVQPDVQKYASSLPGSRPHSNNQLAGGTGSQGALMAAATGSQQSLTAAKAGSSTSILTTGSQGQHLAGVYVHSLSQPVTRRSSDSSNSTASSPTSMTAGVQYELVGNELKRRTSGQSVILPRRTSNNAAAVVPPLMLGEDGSAPVGQSELTPEYIATTNASPPSDAVPEMPTTEEGQTATTVTMAQQLEQQQMMLGGNASSLLMRRARSTSGKFAPQVNTSVAIAASAAGGSLSSKGGGSIASAAPTRSTPGRSHSRHHSMDLRFGSEEHLNVMTPRAPSEASGSNSSVNSISTAAGIAASGGGGVAKPVLPTNLTMNEMQAWQAMMLSEALARSNKAAQLAPSKSAFPPSEEALPPATLAQPPMPSSASASQELLLLPSTNKELPSMLESSQPIPPVKPSKSPDLPKTLIRHDTSGSDSFATPSSMPSTPRLPAMKPKVLVRKNPSRAAPAAPSTQQQSPPQQALPPLAAPPIAWKVSVASPPLPDLPPLPVAKSSHALPSLDAAPAQTIAQRLAGSASADHVPISPLALEPPMLFPSAQTSPRKAGPSDAHNINNNQTQTSEDGRSINSNSVATSAAPSRAPSPLPPSISTALAAVAPTAVSDASASATKVKVPSPVSTSPTGVATKRMTMLLSPAQNRMSEIKWLAANKRIAWPIAFPPPPTYPPPPRSLSRR